LEDVKTGSRSTVAASAIVNAAGPWVGETAERIQGADRSAGIRLVQGSHIVLPKLYAHDRAYFFQNPDGPIFFTIPYEDDFTLDGATAAKDATRDYVLTLHGGTGAPALLSVFGGKITTYRRLAKEALGKLAEVLSEAGRYAGWTASAKVPGGDFPVDGATALAAALRTEYPFLSEREATRYVRHYGTETRRILGDSRRREDLGCVFGGDLTEAEVIHPMDCESAQTAEAVIMRRTRSILRMSPREVDVLADWMRSRQRIMTAADV